MRKERYKTHKPYKSLYVLTDLTDLQLPIAVFDSVEEMAAYTNTTTSNVYSSMCKARKRKSKTKYHIVNYTYEEWHELDFESEVNNYENKKTI